MRRNQSVATAVGLDEASDTIGERFHTGWGEIDRVLGGGLVSGSVILVGGEPGVGKSTLLTGLALGWVRQGVRVLYVAGEESPAQIRLRAERLGFEPAHEDGFEILAEVRLEPLLEALEEALAADAVAGGERSAVIIADSIQTLTSDHVDSYPGSPNQIRHCGAALGELARRRGCPVFLVGHVTKTGDLAGPKLLEHMVDTVLYFETGSGEIRILRSAKNRFGSVDEIGIFRMAEQGLEQVDNPAALFLTERDKECPPGVAVAPVYEGSRILLVEIQSLVVPAKGGISRVFSERIDSGRVSRMAAVLEKHLKVRLSDQDLYVNVGGGIHIGEVGIDLPLSLSLYSARINQPVPPGTATIGEVSLAGEIHPIAHLERRARTVQEMSFGRLIHPPVKEGQGVAPPIGIPAASLTDAVRACFASRPG